jgi:amino acid transporter
MASDYGTLSPGRRRPRPPPRPWRPGDHRRQCDVHLHQLLAHRHGGVYCVVKSAVGDQLAKVAASALLFDYILTGPISAVSAGQYLVGLVLEFIGRLNPDWVIQDAGLQKDLKAFAAMIIALAITPYFFRQNQIGIHESSDKAVKIMLVVTVVAVLNFLIKELATIGGMTFTLLFLETFTVTQRFQKRRQSAGQGHDHVGQFNRQTTAQLVGEFRLATIG